MDHLAPQDFGPPAVQGPVADLELREHEVGCRGADVDTDTGNGIRCHGNFVVGVPLIVGVPLAMIMAALCATERPCIVQNAEIVDRGYERVEEKLRSIGADILREPD